VEIGTERFNSFAILLSASVMMPKTTPPRADVNQEITTRVRKTLHRAHEPTRPY